MLLVLVKINNYFRTTLYKKIRKNSVKFHNDEMLENKKVFQFFNASGDSEISKQIQANYTKCPPVL